MKHKISIFRCLLYRQESEIITHISRQLLNSFKALTVISSFFWSSTPLIPLTQIQQICSRRPLKHVSTTMINLYYWPFPTYSKSAADDFEIVFSKIWKICIIVDIITEQSWIHCAKRRKFSFYYYVFKRRLMQMHQNVSIGGKGLIIDRVENNMIET